MILTTRRAVRLLLAATLLGIALPAAAQNNYSFLRAEESVVGYTTPRAGASSGCELFRSYTDNDASVISAREIAATETVPAHCRIDGIIAPEVGFQVNLPLEWNGRLYMYGNGGYAGTPPEAPTKAAARDAALEHLFATAYTNTGHDSRSEPLATFAHNNRQKELDYAYRAVHLTVNLARRLAAEFYGREPGHSYWDGCSTGGRQGLMSAQRFPGDFDGIIAGAPVLNLTGTQTWNLWNVTALEGSTLTARHIDSVADAIYAKCDSVDGVEDGLIRDPRDCAIEPGRDLPQCDVAADESCLTAVQTDALEKIYGGVISRGEVIFPGLPVGSERQGWVPWLIGADDRPAIQQLFGETAIRYMLFPEDDPERSAKDFDFDNDYDRIAEARNLLDADDPDLRRFRERGGKIIGYFGWADAALNPMMGVDYYEAVIAEMGEKETRDFYRLYMVPGMFHCRGGLGVDRLDALTPLVDWVEEGVVPEGLVAERVEDDEVVRSRPVCPYPEVAVYDGSGSIDDAANFRCGAAD